MTDSLSHRHALRALLISCCGLSVLGSLFVISAWSPTSPEIGLWRSLMFVLLMVVVHALGGVLYLAQQSARVVVDLPRIKRSPVLRRAVRFAILQQTIVVGVSLLMLDGGFAIRGCHVALAAAVVHWLMIGLVLVSRKNEPSALNLALIRYSLPVLCIVGTVLIQPFQH